MGCTTHKWLFLGTAEPLHIFELLLPLCIGIPAVSMTSLAMLDVGSALKVTKATHSLYENSMSHYFIFTNSPYYSLSAASLEREGMRPKDVPCLQCPIMIGTSRLHSNFHKSDHQFVDQFMGADMQQSWTGESMLVLRKVRAGSSEIVVLFIMTMKDLCYWFSFFGVCFGVILGVLSRQRWHCNMCKKCQDYRQHDWKPGTSRTARSKS